MSTPVESTAAFLRYRARILPDLSPSAEALVQQGYEAGFLDGVAGVQRLLEEAADDEESHDLESARDVLYEDRIWCGPRAGYVALETCLGNCGAPENRAVCLGPGRERQRAAVIP